MLQAEAELRVAQGEFDRQSEITKLLLEGISSAHVSGRAGARVVGVGSGPTVSLWLSVILLCVKGHRRS